MDENDPALIRQSLSQLSDLARNGVKKDAEIMVWIRVLKVFLAERGADPVKIEAEFQRQWTGLKQRFEDASGGAEAAEWFGADIDPEAGAPPQES